MYLRQLLRFCPHCGSEAFLQRSQKHFSCDDCLFDCFINPAVSTAAIVVDELQKILLIRRAREPAKGKLALPGGFVDANETAEAGLRREVKEEVGLDLASLEYFYSYPNEYHYRGTTYEVLDLYFVCRTDSPDPVIDLDEVDGCLLLDPDSIDLNDIAFPSMRAAIRKYRANRRQ